jgi:predicted MFS family arabinose efflux permease
LESETQQKSLSTGFLPTLVVVFFAITISNVILALLSPDIARTFFPQSFAAGASAATKNAAIGQVIAQAGAANSAFQVVIALSMTALSERIRNKSLLMIGVVLLLISAVGCYIAQNFLTFQISFALEGAASTMVGIMGISMIGDYLPQQKKARAISYTVAIAAFTAVLVNPFVTFITNSSGWQLNFLLIVLPFSLFGLVLAAIALPSKPKNKSLKLAYKQVLTNRSAIFCMIGLGLFGALVVGNFALPFYRQQLKMPLESVALVQAIAATMYFVAALVIGRLVNKAGAKLLAMICLIANGIFILIFFFMPYAWLAVSLDMTHVWFNAGALVAFAALVLDQVPEFRGTMVSMRAIVADIGAAIGAFVGGTLLQVFGTYEIVGVVMGVLSIAAALVLLGTKDTSKG